MKRILVVAALATGALLLTTGLVSAGQRSMHGGMGDVSQMHDQMGGMGNGMGNMGGGMGDMGNGMGNMGDMGNMDMQSMHDSMPPELIAEHEAMHASMSDEMQQWHDRMMNGDFSSMPGMGGNHAGHGHGGGR